MKSILLATLLIIVGIVCGLAEQRAAGHTEATILGQNEMESTVGGVCWRDVLVPCNQWAAHSACSDAPCDPNTQTCSGEPVYNHLLANYRDVVEDPMGKVHEDVFTTNCGVIRACGPDCGMFFGELKCLTGEAQVYNEQESSAASGPDCSGY